MPSISFGKSRQRLRTLSGEILTLLCASKDTSVPREVLDAPVLRSSALRRASANALAGCLSLIAIQRQGRRRRCAPSNFASSHCFSSSSPSSVAVDHVTSQPGPILSSPTTACSLCPNFFSAAVSTCCSDARGALLSRAREAQHPRKPLCDSVTPTCATV